MINTTDPRVAFYMPYTRAWELALGGIIPFIPEISRAAVFSIQEDTAVDGVHFDQCCRFSVSFARRFYRKQDHCVGIGRFPDHLCNTAKIFSPSNSRVWAIGLHRENLLFDLFVSLADDRVVEALCGRAKFPSGYDLLFIIITIVISWLSWRYIEQPCRRARWNGRVVFPAFFVSELTIGSLCAIVVLTHGASARVPASTLPIGSLEVMWDWACPGYTIKKSLAALEAPHGIPQVPAPSSGATAMPSHFMPMLDVAARRENVSI